MDNIYGHDAWKLRAPEDEGPQESAHVIECPACADNHEPGPCGVCHGEERVVCDGCAACERDWDD